MKLRRFFKKGTKVRFKWYPNYDQYTSINPLVVINEGYIESDTVLNDAIIYSPKEETYYCVPIRDIFTF